MNESTPPDDTPIPPYRHPSNWQFPTLLRQVREKRRFSQEEAAACLPGISLNRYQEWERGCRPPFGWFQTLIVWRLNTSPRPPLSKPVRRHARLPIALPAALGLCVVAAILVHVVASHRSLSPDLASSIAREASRALGYQVDAASYQTYADDLKGTLSQFDQAQREHILGGEITLMMAIAYGE